MNLSKLEKVAADIRALKIQGATRIAKAGLEGIKGSLEGVNDKDEILEFLKKALEMLRVARPTEPLLFNGISFVEDRVKQGGDAAEAIDEFIELDRRNDRQMIEEGWIVIKDGDHVLTHCHSGSVVGLLKKAHQEGTRFKVWNTETRPLFQGRITSQDLVEAGIDTTMIVDSSAEFLINDISGDELDMDQIFLGSDAIRLDGSVINKIGSFGIAMAAKNSDDQVYVVANLLKTDASGGVQIEKRDPDEVWADAPEGLKVLNFAFDIVPADYITGIITEFGVIEPGDVGKLVRENYPWMFD